MKITTPLTAAASGILLSVSLNHVHATVFDVASWDLTDFNNDGLRSDFAFFSLPSGNSSGNQFGYTPETSCINAPNGDCVSMSMDGTAVLPGVFTAGFNLGGSTSYHPYLSSGGASATIDTAINSGIGLNLTAFNFGTYVGTGNANFLVAPLSTGPDYLVNCTGTAGCGTVGYGYNVETFSNLGNGLYGVVVRYASTINEPGSSFNGYVANYRLEGIMTTSAIPIPAAGWLFASGLLGLAGMSRARKTRTPSGTP